jgi:hypothetical protein
VERVWLIWSSLKPSLGHFFNIAKTDCILSKATCLFTQDGNCQKIRFHPHVIYDETINCEIGEGRVAKNKQTDI